MSGGKLAKTASARKRRSAVRVMLVDDSRVSRTLMRQWLEIDHEIEVVAMASTGEEAIDLASSHDLDVIVLDVEMPGMGGIKALPHIIKVGRGARVLMVSTLTSRNARITLEALENGATDALAKPKSGWASALGPQFRQEFVRKIHALGGVSAPRSTPAKKAVSPKKLVREPAHSRATPSQKRPAVIAVGASTGGPNALFDLISGLPKPLDVPILVTQHMPPTFTAILAEHIEKRSGIPSVEAADHMVVEDGKVYVAPGGLHMEVVRAAGIVRLRLSEAPPENFCRPSVNPMLRSAAEIWGAETLGVMLTGMGTDGLEGAREVVAVGGTMLAQDRESSIIWGMPGAIVREGLAAEVLPLSGLSSAIGCLLEAGS